MSVLKIREPDGTFKKIPFLCGSGSGTDEDRVNELIDIKTSQLDIPSDDHINGLIDVKTGALNIPTDAHINGLIDAKTGELDIPTDEHINSLIDTKTVELDIPSDVHINNLIDTRLEGLAPSDGEVKEVHIGPEAPTDDSVIWIDTDEDATTSVLPFRLGIDENGNYGYYKVGADTLTPFKSGGSNWNGITVSFKYEDGVDVAETKVGQGVKVSAPSMPSYTRWFAEDNTPVSFPYTPIEDTTFYCKYILGSRVLTFSPESGTDFVMDTDDSVVSPIYGGIATSRRMTIYATPGLPAASSYSGNKLSVRSKAQSGYIFGSFGGTSTGSGYNTSVIYPIRNNGKSAVQIRYFSMNTGGGYHAGSLYIAKDLTMSGDYLPANVYGSVNFSGGSKTLAYLQEAYGNDWNITDAFLDDNYPGWEEKTIELNGIGEDDIFYLWIFNNDARWGVSSITLM